MDIVTPPISELAIQLWHDQYLVESDEEALTYVSIEIDNLIHNGFCSVGPIKLVMLL